ERQDLEQLVAGAEAPWKDHERLCEIREPELPHEEVVELEVQPFCDVGIGALFEWQANIEPDRLPAGLARAAVGGLHDSGPATRSHDEPMVFGLKASAPRRPQPGEFSRLLVVAGPFEGPARFAQLELIQLVGLANPAHPERLQRAFGPLPAVDAR